MPDEPATLTLAIEHLQVPSLASRHASPCVYLLADALLDDAVKLAVVGERPGIHLDPRRDLGDDGQLLEHLIGDLVAKVVRLEEARGVAADGLREERLAAGMRLEKVGDVVGLAADHGEEAAIHCGM